MKTVHLGYEVGTGAPVAIPLRHLAVTGQTQEAGKTTTLEALISRSGLRAVTFITKRGEGSFKNARRIAPYFREQTDWQFVASILEASRGEKLKFERAWIIRASKGARTLADVHANVRAALEKRSTGKDADVYTVLDAYLEVVVPEIARVKWAPAVELQPGVNAVDLGGLTIEMQHLVIRSTINWVLEREHGTVIVVPEAWKFIPQGRGTPVKLAAEALIRQGAAVGNYLWLDSQDLGGIEKAILRSVAVWLLGVQREANELKRTLDNIPAGAAKPKAADLAQLQLGQFYACWGAHTVRTYVQPAFLSEEQTRAIARGEAAIHAQSAASRSTFRNPTTSEVEEPEQHAREEAPEVCERHVELERELAALKRDHEKDKARAAEQLGELRAALHKANGTAADLQKGATIAADLGRILARLLPTPVDAVLEALPVDEDALVARVLERLPRNGSVPVTVTPPEKLRQDFQRQEAERIVAAARAFDPLAKRVLKLLVAAESRLRQKEIAERLGRSSTSGGGMKQLAETVKALADAGLVSVDSNGVAASVLTKIDADLAVYQPGPGDVEAVYQNVLHELATEA